MHHREAPQNHPVTHVHVTGQLRVVGEDGVAANLTIVGQMHVSHDPVVVADTRHARIRGRSYVERAEFADRVAVPQNQLTRFTRVFFVLRDRAQ